MTMTVEKEKDTYEWLRDTVKLFEGSTRRNFTEVSVDRLRDALALISAARGGALTEDDWAALIEDAFKEQFTNWRVLNPKPSIDQIELMTQRGATLDLRADGSVAIKETCHTSVQSVSRVIAKTVADKLSPPQAHKRLLPDSSQGDGT